MPLCLLALQLLLSSVITKLETQYNIYSRLASTTFNLSFHNNSTDNHYILRNKLSALRLELMQLFNQHTPDESLHFSCPKSFRKKTEICQTQFVWHNRIEANNGEQKLSAERDKAVFEQIKLLLKTNGKFKQVFIELKQTEKAYLSMLGK